MSVGMVVAIIYTLAHIIGGNTLYPIPRRYKV